MENFDVSLSLNEIHLIMVCLSSCGAQCFSSGNDELGLSYLGLYDRFQNLLS